MVILILARTNCFQDYGNLFKHNILSNILTTKMSIEKATAMNP